MVPFYNSPGFWGFLTALVGSVRYLLRVAHVYISRQNKEKFDQNIKVENIHADTTNRTLKGLNDAMNQIIPMVKHHEEVVKNLEKSCQMVGMIEGNLTKMFEPLKTQHEEFLRIVPKMTASWQKLVDEFADLKTEVQVLKKGSGNVFVTTKKN